MSGRQTMKRTISSFRESFSESIIYLGVSQGREAEAFDKLIEAAWDLGCVGVRHSELLETMRDYGFDPAEPRGNNILVLAERMYDTSLDIHDK